MPVKYPCRICQKNVNKCKAICCDCCDSWVHFKCSNLNNLEYDRLDQCSDLWFCAVCLSESLPFSPDIHMSEVLNKYPFTELFSQLNQRFESIQESEDDDKVELSNVLY